MRTVAQRPAPSKPEDAAVRTQRAADAARDAALRTLAAQATTRYAGEQIRIAKGLVIALNHGATLQADGTALVKSQTDDEIVYTVNGVCDCPDATHRTHGAPEGRCKHRWAKTLTVRALALTQAPETITTLSEQLYGPQDAAAAAQRTACGQPAAQKESPMAPVRPDDDAPDEDDEASLQAAMEEYNTFFVLPANPAHGPGSSPLEPSRLRPLARPAPAPPSPAACPEAAFSLCLKGRLDGQDAQLTIRGATYAEFAANVAAVRGLFDAPAPSQPASTPGSPAAAPAVPTCPDHGPLTPSTKAAGTYYCTKKLADGSYCKCRQGN